MKKTFPQINLAMLKRTRLLTCLLIAGIVAVVMSMLFVSGFYSNIQLKLADYMYGGGQPLSNIVIVSIDDRSIQEIGRWPWARSNFTDLMTHLSNAKVVGYDVAFFEKSDDAIDETLGMAVKKQGKVVMPVEYTKFENKAEGIASTEVMKPITPISNSAAALGYINVVTDNDGVTRSINSNIAGKYKPMAYEVVNQYLTKPLPAENRFLINFIGRPGAFKRYAFVDVVNGKYPDDEFSGKIILIGSTANDLHDNYFVPTSYGKAMPGVEIHANLVQQIITGKRITNSPTWLTTLIIFMAAGLAVLLVMYLPVWLSPILLVVGAFGYVFIAILVFNLGVILNIVFIPVTLLFTYGSTLIYFYLSEKKARKKVLGALEKYVSKEVVSEILEHPEKLKLGGEKRTITIFFSDIRGFTTISEKLSPEKLVHLLNEYLTAMTNIIMKDKGVVDKYMGDAIMAFWNAPLDNPKHAEMACKAALEMERKLKEMQTKWKKEGVPPLEIGVGLNTGPAVVGNMGSYERFDYTAMGDTVNLGSRLEGLNKQYGTRIIVSESTMKEVSKKFVFKKLDKVAVKGKKEPITIYELIGATADEATLTEVKHFEAGLDAYFNQKWADAITHFKKADKTRKEGDFASKEFITRCSYFKEHAPGKDWDGSWVMKTK